MDRQQRRYEAKKALLKRIKFQWGLRLEDERKRHCNPEHVGQTDNRSYAIIEYIEARDRLDRFIQSSVAHHIVRNLK